MCLRPIQINNPTKRIVKTGGQLLKMQVRCNHCYECIEANRSEWRFRAYHEAKDTISKGGYVYFDTLTYSDEHVPHLSDFIDICSYGISDFMCFDYRHFRLFIKRLRRYLDYHFGNSEFKYFMSTEYGTSDTGTHRPHLHINFYVLSGIHPLTFSKAVHDCWQYGRCDGICEHGAKYVSEHIYGYDIGFGSNTTDSILLKLCNYVSKYITKDSTFQHEIDKRIKLLESHIDDSELLKNLKRSVSMYHRQSQGFGISYIYNMSHREIKHLLEINEVILPSSETVVATAPIPMYYKRKLFYQLHKREDGSYYWQLTPIGEYYHSLNMLKRVDKHSKAVEECLHNASDEEVEYVTKLLAGRSLHDFSIYKVFYQGRMRSSDSYDFSNLCPIYDLVDNEYNLHDWIDEINKSNVCNSLGDYQVYAVDDYNQVQLNYFHTYDKSELFDKLAFNQDSCPAFTNFDRLDCFILSIKKPTKDNQQKLFEYKEHLTKIFKHV